MMRSSVRTRRASHSNSWYSGSGEVLRKQVSELLDRAAPAMAPMLESVRDSGANIRAIISPHAGIQYSGLTAAHAFAALQKRLPDSQRIFVLGPNHYVSRLRDLRVSSCAAYQTPMGDIPIDTQFVDEMVRGSKGTVAQYSYLTQEQDEDEHSLEMMMPFIAAALSKSGGSRAKLVPIVVGSISREQERAYGAALAPHLADPKNVFVISSDFCHWGPRFGYQYHYRPGEYPDVGEAVQAMDRRAIELIEAQDLDGLWKYFQETQNTICGRHPIGILLEAMKGQPDMYRPPNFVHYSQSSRLRSPHDNTVSYASAVVAAR